MISVNGEQRDLAGATVAEVVDRAYRDDTGRAVATLIRVTRDFDLAEEALHEAFAAALRRWPRDGVPAHPRAWLVSAGRFKAIDTPRTGSAYAKHHHPASGYAVAGVAAIVWLGEDGVCQEARVAVTGTGHNAKRAPAVEQALVGKALDEAAITQAAASAADGHDLLSDWYASAEYRAHLARVYTKRALMMAAQRARNT